MRVIPIFSFLAPLILSQFALAAPMAPIGINEDLFSYRAGSLATGRGASAGYWNPAALGYDPSPFEAEFMFSLEGDEHVEYEENAFFVRMGILGFGVVHDEDDVLDNAGNIVDRGFADHYKLGIGGGSKGHYWGISYNWSRGSSDALRQNDNLTFASLDHLHRYVSLGSRISAALGETHGLPEVVLEGGLALRPFTDRLSLTIDAAGYLKDGEFVNKRGQYSEQYWVGVEGEPFDWLSFGTRYNLISQNWTVQAGLQTRGLGFGALLPQAEDDALEPGNRAYVHLNALQFNKGFQIKPKKELFARIDLKGNAGEYRYLNVGQSFRLMDFYRSMEEARKHPRVKGLYLHMHPGFNADPTLLYEIRQQIQQYKDETGGEVAFYSESHGLGSLFIASVADRRAMLPIGDVSLDNFGRESVYYADALEEAGIDFVRYNVGAWKGAGENFDRNGMSPEVRENVGRALTELHDFMVESIRESYGFSQDEMDEIMARWMINRDDALRFGLVDTLLYEDKVEDWVCRRSDDDDEDDNGGVKIGISFGEPDKGDKVIPISRLRTPLINRRWGVKPEIAVVYASGPIMPGRSLGPFLIGSDTVVEQLRRARKDDNVKAVVFHIDSPGGSGYASDLVWHEMELLKEKKPLIINQGFLAASGGYYLSMAGDTILSSPVTITGSIGVAAGIFFNKGVLENAGLKQDGVWAGKPESMGGAMVPVSLGIKSGSAQLRMPTLPLLGRMLTPSQDEELHGVIRHFYKDFVQKVADGRGMEWDEVDAIAEGRIWSGPSARELGLVDQMGSLQDAIDIALLKAELDKEDMDLRQIHPEFSFEDLIKMLSMLGQGGLSTAREQLMLEQIGLSDQARIDLLGTARPELLFDDEPFRNVLR